ncbi:Two-component sensor histidine kinase, contains HisKA and HATPase domains [Tardiphaga sp. OK246]|uniref:sensor histidine kinase n=1 Tax=Tardiphaga sp. OK246 TaxID=1855307 RepID=UPI000B6B2974|nr:HWE histidine kinase domain-containing protein [Tardiphaga sp. OK246]SNT52471.1 Two-component sensor histidine kinase, contains HisKA and HATPase domains [Tardiphaga sp. OK246]
MSSFRDKTNVLVVEDEMVLRMRAVDIVEDAGFTAVEATNADQAISVLEARSDISLLFSDIQMPGSMDGLKLAHAVHERWPQIKIILVSGQITPSSDEKPENSRFFGKPIDSKEMIAELQDMIGAGTLEVVSGQAGLTVNPTRPSQSVAEETLTAENDSLRLLLEQAGIDAKLLLAQAGIDAKEREAADKLQKLVLGELHHRIKNTLATVSAIASQSLRTATSVQHAQQAIEGRLLALGRAHDLLMQVSWASAGLEMTIRNATEPYDNKGVGRFAVSGPEVDMGSGAVIALAMTLNELCTNATKFGALSDPSGIVKVDWTIDEASQQLTLSWIESGGALVNPPVRRSFGTRMMESLGRQLSGTVRLAYPPSGFTYTLEVPIASLNK